MLKNKINIIAFLLMLVCFMTIIVVFPRDERTIERENRAFYRLPEISVQNIFSGGFSRDFGPYLSDRVGYRASFVTAAKKLEYSRGLGKIEARISGGTLVLTDRLMEIYLKNDWTAARYCEVISSYRESFGDGVRMFSLIAPTQLEFSQEKYRELADSQRDTISHISAELENAGLIPVDAYAAIAEHTGEYIYFRTDHHWTARGAYYAYTAFAEAAGFEPVPIEDYSYNSAGGFYGYLYNREPVSGMESDTIEWYDYANIVPETEVFFPPKAGEKVTYNMFLNGDHDKLIINTGQSTGKTAVIIKASYANAFIPWLVPHYDTIVVLDPRKFEGSACEIIAEYDNVDVLFVNYVFSTTFADFIEMMDKIK